MARSTLRHLNRRRRNSEQAVVSACGFFLASDGNQELIGVDGFAYAVCNDDSVDLSGLVLDCYELFNHSSFGASSSHELCDEMVNG